jgi:hypothetical protein
MEKKVFTICDASQFTFVGYDSETRWNGWCMPYFSEKTLLEILEKNAPYVREDDESIYSFEDGVFYETYDGEKIVVSEGKMINGEMHYLHSIGWIWDVDSRLSRIVEEIQSIVDDVTFTDKEVMDEMYSYLIDVRERGIVVETYTNGRTQALMTINAINQFINQ